MVRTAPLLKTLYWLAGGLVALLVLASLAVSFLDWNQYRSTLSAMASDRMGMRVELAGRVSVGLLPRPEVSAEAVRLFPVGGAGEEVVATADRIDMRLGLSALLKGEVAFQRLAFDGLDVVFEENVDGDWRVRGWPEAAENVEDDQQTTIQMERLQIVGGTVRFVENTGAERVVEGLSFDLKGRLPQGPLEWSGSFVATGQKVVTEGRMRPGRTEDALSLKADITLDGGTLGVSGRLFDDGFAGRIQSQGENLGAFFAAVQSVAGNRPTPRRVPDIGFTLDVQVDREAGIYRAISRQIDLGGTHGRLDVTIAQRGRQFHTAGSASLGIVDIKPWLDAAASQLAETEPAAVADVAPQLLNGALDVTIEGVHLGGGVIQQLDAVVRFTDEGPRLDTLQALLPGGSGLSFSGQMMADRGAGNLQLMSGNLPELLRWAGVDVSNKIPAGRLATGEMESSFTLEGDRWVLSDVNARVDTSNLTGEVSGNVGSIWPTRVELAADSVNLDAYVSGGQGGMSSSDFFTSLPDEVMQFQVTAGAVRWNGQQYEHARMVGELSNGLFKVAEFHLAKEGGTLALSGSARPSLGTTEVEAEIDLAAWPLSILRTWDKDTAAYIRALKVRAVDGKVSASGPLSDMHLSAQLHEGDARQLKANGSLSLDDGRPGNLGLQGTFKHENLSPLIRLMGGEVRRPTAADLTYAIERSGKQPTQVNLSGRLAGGQLLAEGTLREDLQDWQVTYDHRHASEVIRRLGFEAELPDPKGALRGAGKLTVSKTGWKASDLDMRNGAARLSGNLDAGQPGKITGHLTATGIDYSPRPAGRKKASSEAVALKPALFETAGQIDLALDQVTIAGQKIVAPDASFVAGDGVLRMDLGPQATVNGSPASLSFDLTGGEMPSVNGRANIANIDIGELLAAQGLRAALSGTTSLDFTFEGQGQSLDALLQSLKGHGEMKGRAGSLNFLSVPVLVREMGRAPSASVFLGAIGTWLRQGSTIYSDLEAGLTLDSGTILLERFLAKGDWGGLTFDGQVNLPDAFLSLKGQLALSSPPDAPVIPVQYEGPLDNPTSNWASRALESFVIAGIERRIRSGLLKDLDKIQGSNTPANPGGEVFNRAFDLLGLLRKKQKAEEETEEEEEDDPNAKPSPGTEGRMP